MNRALLSNVSTGVLVVCAVLITGLVLRREVFPPQEPSVPVPPAPTRAAAPGLAHAADTGLVIGPPTARVRILEFSDFQCPFCAAFARSVQKMRKEHPGQIAVVWRNLPLTRIHPFALAAANAAECANAQGRFEAFHDTVFAHQDKLGTWTWNRFAREAGIPDRTAYAQCIADSLYAGRVKVDREAAAANNFQSTPTIIVNGTLYDGLPSDSQMQAWLSVR